MRHFFFLTTVPGLMCCLLTGASVADQDQPAVPVAEIDSGYAYDYLNQLRTAAGLVPFVADDRLQQAANSHSRYLVVNRAQGHFQSRGLPEHSGYSAVERVILYDYPTSEVSENVSIATKDDASVKQSIDGLMAAIYHRLGFLSFTNDEVGISIMSGNDYSAFTYKMGNQGKADLCLGNNYLQPGRYYQGMCVDTEKRIQAENWESSESVIARQNPSLVLWPPHNHPDIPPAFDHENPDPLPDYGVSGYPVSVQFNPEIGDNIVIERFVLLDEQYQAVTPTRILDQKTDPNDMLTDREFVLFPLRRLQWDSLYRVELDYRINGKLYTHNWSFRTSDPGLPMFTIQQPYQVIRVQSGEPFLVYLPPLNPSDIGSSYQTHYQSTLSPPEIEPIDANTLSVRLTGQGSIWITSHRRTFEVQVF